jgi:arginyl-tRNA synthetase
MKEKVKKALNEILLMLGWDVDFDVKEPPQEIKFDLASNIPIIVSKKYKVEPQVVFEQIKSLCLKHFGTYLFSYIEYTQPGFFNFNLSKDLLFEEVKKIILYKENYPVCKKEINNKVLIEFVSANPTGPLHIGHGRCAVLGDVLGNIFKKLGYEVTKEYYVNNIGRQINVLSASVIMSLYNYDSLSVDNDVKTFCEKIVQETSYKGEYIKEIALKVKSKFEKVNNNNFKQVQKFIVETIMDEIKISLNNFRVVFDNYFYEETLYEPTFVEKVKGLLIKNNLVEEKDNALWFKSAQFGDDKDRVIIRSNGEPTYFFSDILYHYNKIKRGYDLLINIWGTDHHGYVERIKSVFEKICSFENCNTKLEIILYQLVSLIKDGQRISMSTREGKFITLDEVVNEVGVDVTRFFLLTKSPNTHLDFDFELAKEHSLKNPVYYIQYAHTRCCSILSEVAKIVSLESINSYLEEYFKQLYEQKFYDSEIELIKKLVFYPDILNLCIETFSVHHLCNYLIELAKIFHKFYEECRVIDKNKVIIYPRLLLVIATKNIIKNALDVLNISAPQKM